MPAVSAAAAAVAFLTRVPVRMQLDAADLTRGAALFPLVGLGIGAAVGGIAAVPLPATVAAVLAVAAGAVLTGALHLDGLADTADALGARTREHALEIMRDHAIGAYGAVALVLDLAAKAAALAALARHGDALRFTVCAAAAARAAPLVLSAALPYARPGAGLGRAVGSTGWARCAVAGALAAGFCVWLDALPLLAAATGVVLVAGLGARRWLGGVTGDVLGATAELAELAALVTAVALL